MKHKVIESYQLENGKINKLELNEFFNSELEHPFINVYDISKGNFYGFGGAITQAASKNYSLLSSEQKKQVIKDICGEDGLRLNIFRFHIGSADFTEKEYCYVKDDDDTLETFSIECDKKEIIPFAKDIIAGCKYQPTFFASCWSAPAFMKDNGKRINGGHLKLEYYDLYAEYLCKFVLAYAQEGIKISGLTIQNESKASQTWESCVFNIEQEIAFAKVLKKHLKKHKLNVKLYCWDHNCERLYVRAAEAFKEKNLFSGAAYHWYSGEHFDNIELLKTQFEDKFVFLSEYCYERKVDETDTGYANEQIGSISHRANALVDWNLILDEEGGPYHNRNIGGCYAPFVFNKQTKTLENTQLFKETYMLSHFIEPGAEILYTSVFDSLVKVCACKNPNGNIVVNVLNKYKDENFHIFLDNEVLDFKANFNTVTTLVIK